MDSIHALVEGFKPLHFVAGMGIGMCASIMYTFPIESVRHGMKYVGYIYFFTNIVVILINHLLFSLKFLIFPAIFPNDHRYKHKFFDLLHTPHLAVFMGASAMSLTPMINMIHAMKPSWHTFTWVLWWINFSQALGCTFIVFFFIMTTANLKLESDSKIGLLDHITPTLILPVITCTVTGASGAYIAIDVSNGDATNLIAMIIITTMMSAIAICFSFLLLAVVFTRIFSYGIPRYGNAFSMFVPIGFMGQGSWAILTNCKNLSYLIENHGFESIGLRASTESFEIVHNVLMIFGVFFATSLSAFGIAITIYGILSVFYWYIGWPSIPKKMHLEIGVEDVLIKFNKEFIMWTPTMWAATFPFGTIVLSTDALYKETNIIGFKVVASIYAFAVVIITSWCMFCSFVYILPWNKIMRKAKEDELERDAL